MEQEGQGVLWHPKHIVGQMSMIKLKLIIKSQFIRIR
jgi:hypothetical protein